MESGTHFRSKNLYCKGYKSENSTYFQIRQAVLQTVPIYRSNHSPVTITVLIR